LLLAGKLSFETGLTFPVVWRGTKAPDLRQLRALLTADALDVTAIGLLLSVLGEQVHGVASGSLGEGVGGKLRLLSGLLVTEGRAVSDRS
jgi:hypothetical protein